MKICALVSGGKDSIYTLCKMKDEGHEIVVCIYMLNKKESCDSYMYQTVGNEMIVYLEKVLKIPFIIKETECNAKNVDLEYKRIENDEVEDLYEAIKEAKNIYNVEGVCSGAIESNYQKNRVENVCSRLNLQSFAPLWKRNQKELLLEMINYGIKAIIIKIASPLLERRHVGVDLKEVYNYLESVESRWDINYCGEGGEYETMTLDCKYFINRLKIVEGEICIHPEDVDKQEEEQVVFYKIKDVLEVEK